MISSASFTKITLNFIPASVSSGFLFTDFSNLFLNRIIQAVTHLNFVQLPIPSNDFNILDWIVAKFTFIDFTLLLSCCILQSISYLLRFSFTVIRELIRKKYSLICNNVFNIVCYRSKALYILSQLLYSCICFTAAAVFLSVFTVFFT